MSATASQFVQPPQAEKKVRNRDEAIEQPIVVVLQAMTAAGGLPEWFKPTQQFPVVNHAPAFEKEGRQVGR